jgi:hypothetical protein
MNKSDSIKELATALNKAQSQMLNAHKKSDNPYFNSKYANLSEVLDCVKGAFSDNGLSFTQMPSFDSGVVQVETMLMHDSGEWICSIAGSPISKNNPQGVGDAVTYLRRYSLAAISGLGQEDDDGNSNNGNSTEKGNDDKNWYSDELLAEHRPYIIGQKNAGVTPEAIVKKMRDKYKVANKYKQLIEDMT